MWLFNDKTAGQYYISIDHIFYIAKLYHEATCNFKRKWQTKYNNLYLQNDAHVGQAKEQTQYKQIINNLEYFWLT